MKKIFYSVLCLFISFYAFAFSFDEKFPADKKTETIVQFMLKECPLDNGSFDINKNCWNNFTYFFENNKEDWVIPFCKAFNARLYFTHDKKSVKKSYFRLLEKIN